MWKNTVERSRTQMAIWRMLTECWIPKTINTHSGCGILIAFPLQQWLHKCASTLCYSTLHVLLIYIGYLTCNFSSEQLVTPYWWTLRGPKHVGVYFRVLNLHVFYVVVSFIRTASYIKCISRTLWRLLKDARWKSKGYLTTSWNEDCVAAE
jgi:hypothetical protein